MYHMRAMERIVQISLSLLFLVMGLTVAEAQSYRYIDSSGNIHFVDSLGEVPRQYREQIVPPTPTVAVDAKTAKRLEAQRQRELVARQREIERKKREKEREKERQQRIAEKLAAKQAAKEAAMSARRSRAVDSSTDSPMEQFK